MCLQNFDINNPAFITKCLVIFLHFLFCKRISEELLLVLWRCGKTHRESNWNCIFLVRYFYYLSVSWLVTEVFKLFHHSLILVGYMNLEAHHSFQIPNVTEHKCWALRQDLTKSPWLAWLCQSLATSGVLG